MRTGHAFGLILLLAGSLAASAQEERKPVPATQLREADVSISRRMWRVIDLREKYDYKALYPGNPLSKVLYDAVLTGKLRAYRDDSLRNSWSVEQFVRIGVDTQLVRVLLDPNDDDSYRTDTVVSPFVPEERVFHLMLMEEWYFDKKLSTTSKRIAAIAPLYRMKVAGYDLGLQPLCWLRYDDRISAETDCRDVLVNQYIFNPENSRSRFSYDDWFIQQQFHAYVVKESNVHDLYLMDDPDVKRNGLEALIRAAIIKQHEFEKDASHFEE